VLYPWLGTLSVAAVALGGYLLWTRSTDWRRRHAGDMTTPMHHDRVCLRPDGRLSRRGILTLAFAGASRRRAPSRRAGAIQAHRVVYGLALVAAFSAGWPARSSGRDLRGDAIARSPERRARAPRFSGAIAIAGLRSPASRRRSELVALAGFRHAGSPGTKGSEPAGSMVTRR
jgi:hypothetical protein